MEQRSNYAVLMGVQIRLRKEDSGPSTVDVVAAYPDEGKQTTESAVAEECSTVQCKSLEGVRCSLKINVGSNLSGPNVSTDTSWYRKQRREQKCRVIYVST
eukprot:scaffold35894_cov250-Skeletonema_dohrnii-CCMP3373.AAC.4